MLKISLDIIRSVSVSFIVVTYKISQRMYVLQKVSSQLRTSKSKKDV